MCMCLSFDIVAGLPLEQILAYFVELELSGDSIAQDMLLPLFSELTTIELEEQLQEDEMLATLIM